MSAEEGVCVYGAGGGPARCEVENQQELCLAKFVLQILLIIMKNKQTNFCAFLQVAA